MMLEHTGKHGELVQFGTMKTGPYIFEVEPFSLLTEQIELPQ